MTCVAVQYTNQGGGGTYDLSVVFDPAWPGSGGGKPVAGLTAYQPGSVGLVYTPAGQLTIYGVGQDNILYMTPLNADGTAGTPVAVTFPLTFT